MAGIFDVIEKTESLLLIGGALLFAYWFMTSDATAEIRESLAEAIPRGVSLDTPPEPGTEIDQVGGAIGTTTDGNTQYHVSSSGAISVFIHGAVQDFGPSYVVPGTGMTIAQLRTSGYSNGDIATLLDRNQ